MKGLKIERLFIQPFYKAHSNPIRNMNSKQYDAGFVPGVGKKLADLKVGVIIRILYWKIEVGNKIDESF